MTATGGWTLYSGGSQFSSSQPLNQVYVPFFGAFGAAWDDAMVAMGRVCRNDGELRHRGVARKQHQGQSDEDRAGALAFLSEALNAVR